MFCSQNRIPEAVGGPAQLAGRNSVEALPCNLFSSKHSSAFGLRVGFKRIGLPLEESVHGWRRCTKPLIRLSGGLDIDAVGTLCLHRLRQMLAGETVFEVL